MEVPMHRMISDVRSVRRPEAYSKNTPNPTALNPKAQSAYFPRQSQNCMCSREGADPHTPRGGLSSESEEPKNPKP